MTALSARGGPSIAMVAAFLAVGSGIAFVLGFAVADRPA